VLGEMAMRKKSSYDMTPYRMDRFFPKSKIWYVFVMF
jgi:hypothetical protein